MLDANRFAFAEYRFDFWRGKRAPLVYNHNREEMLGSATFSLDSRGYLLFDAEIRDTTRRVDVQKLISAGDLSGMSITFEVKKITNETLDGEPVESVSDLLVRELSLATIPADDGAKIQSFSRQSKAGGKNSTT